MNVTTFLLSILMLSCNLKVARGTFLFILRFQLAMKGYMNSFYNSEIAIEGATAQDLYFMERADQLNQLDNARKKREKLIEKKTAAKKVSVSDLNPTKAGLKLANIGRLKAQLMMLDNKIEKLEKELRSNRFCSMPDICGRAFKNSFFTKKNQWVLKDENSTETKCVEKTIVVKKGGKSFGDMRQYVKCKTKNAKDGEKGPAVFLEVSTRYVPGKNLKYFALLDHDNDGFVKPIAYLMNAKDSDLIEIPIEEEQTPLLEEKASKTDAHS